MKTQAQATHTGRQFVDSGVCVGGPRDRTQIATDPTTDTFSVPEATGSGPQSLNYRVHYYRREFINGGDTVFSVWVHHDIVGRGLVERLLEGYVRK